MNSKKPKTNKQDKVLILNENFKDFQDFFENNRYKIYENIIEIFSEFSTTKKKKSSLKVSAKIDGLDWDTDFSFYRNEYIVLRKDLMPYFEEIEDYEMCDKIINIEKNLTNNK